MGERKGQNKYYPPDFDPKKHKSLNGYHGTHALRERARKLDQGILIVRFEMPYNIWCDGCKAHIAMGVRYNAQKSKIGMYFSTPIFQFKMKCHLCDQHFLIKTDPQNSDYVIESGARRKEQRWSMAENEQIVTDQKEEIKRMAIDPMFSLEHEKKDKEKLTKVMPSLKELEQARLEWKDDYRLNSLMRDVLREEKKAINEEKKLDKALLDKWNLEIKLVKEHEDDIKLASLYKYNTVKNEIDEEKARLEKRKLLENESIFHIENPVIKKSKDANSKDLQINNLKEKLNKSIVVQKISNSGGFSGNSDSSIKNKNTLNLKNLVKLNNKQVNIVNKPSTSSSFNETSMNQLVSNDYDSNDDGDD